MPSVMHPRRWLLLLLLIGFVALVTSRFTDAKQLVRTLSQGQWQWVLVAIILHVVYFILYAVLYQAGFNDEAFPKQLADDERCVQTL